MLVIGHRGASAFVPENTVEAMRAAVAARADGVEFDVRLTADGFPIVMHDDDLVRMTGVPGTVASSTFEQLRRLRIGTQGARIPTVEEVLAVVAGLRVVLLELKTVHGADGTYSARAVLEAIAGRVEHIPGLVLTSFDPVALLAAHTLFENAPTALACYRNPDEDWMLRVAIADTHQAVSIPAEQVDEEFVRAAHDGGTHVYAFSAPADDAPRFDELGVDAIITSDPARALRLLR